MKKKKKYIFSLLTLPGIDAYLIQLDISIHTA